MPKKIVQDVVPPEGKSIRNIPLSPKRQAVSVSRRARASTVSAPAPVTSVAPDITPPPRMSTPSDIRDSGRLDSKREYADLGAGRIIQGRGTKNAFSRKKGVWITGGVCILAIAFALSFLFVSAEVQITPKTETVDLSAPLVAKKTASNGDLGFQMITLSKEYGKIVGVNGEEQVDKKATGRITIFNKNSKSQQLVAGTRFQTPSGLIYKLNSAVTVPAATKKGSETTPGSISATVTAEKGGTGYNTGLSDFTLPGFKGGPKYTTVYARSETAMEGGFSGLVKSVLPETLESAETDIESALKEQLTKEATAQLPDNFILYPGATSFSFEDMPQTEQGETSVKVNKKGTLTGIILDKNAINRELASETLTPAAAGDVYVANLESLEFSLPTITNWSTVGNKDIPFILKGQAHFVWIFDQEKIKRDLVGKSKKNLGSVLSIYPSIEKAKAVLHPFWKLSFPKDSDKITIEIVD